MANLWRFKQKVLIDTEPNWPALIKCTFKLTPPDFFERNENTPIKTTIFGDTEIQFDPKVGKILGKKTGDAPPLEHSITMTNGFVSINGNNATAEFTVDNLEHAVATLDWLIRVFSGFLSIQLKTYCDLHDFSGTINEIPMSIVYEPHGLSATMFHTEPNKRAEEIEKAFQLIDPNSPSYMRFVASSAYFHQALRLTSPFQVDFPPDLALGEVVLNLAKCIELLFSPSRNELRKKLLLLDYTEDQIESQLISIAIVRNELDIGHPLSGFIDADEITELRIFAHRALENVQAMLKRTASKIRSNRQFLAPLTNSGDKDRKKLISKIKTHLAKPSLSEK